MSTCKQKDFSRHRKPSILSDALLPADQLGGVGHETIPGTEGDPADTQKSVPRKVIAMNARED
jgi:hypothetical protein